jgi:hypothetical protein
MSVSSSSSRSSTGGRSVSTGMGGDTPLILGCGP